MCLAAPKKELRTAAPPYGRPIALLVPYYQRPSAQGIHQAMQRLTLVLVALLALKGAIREASYGIWSICDAIASIEMSCVAQAAKNAA
jgi:hypothetical protein